ncbi:MAG: hypothetical protein RLZ04_1712 [Actinomycetota bacterium]
MTKVVVIGAGLAGLRCATDLVTAGVDVTVLEARDRVGGRVWSHRFDDGQVCERGAEFIDGDHHEVLALARRLGLSLSTRETRPDPTRVLVDAGGRVAPVHLVPGLVDDLARWEEAFGEMAANAGPGDDDATLADLLASLGLGVMARLVIGREIRTEYMLPPEEVSQWFAALVDRRRDPSTREQHRVVGGNDQLAQGLADALGDVVRLSAEVTAIDAEGGVATIDEGGEISADAVVAAVPLPVLSRMWPEMPLELGAVAYGLGAKISIQYGRRLWRDLGRDGTVLSDRAWGHLWETTDDQSGDRGVLTNLLASYDGASFGSLPGAVVSLMREIERIFPGSSGLALERVRTDWTNDRFSLGCYACFGRGQWTAASPSMAQPHGRLWIAGEHASEWSGFMEGALRSGASVAAALTR